MSNSQFYLLLTLASLIFFGISFLSEQDSVYPLITWLIIAIYLAWSYNSSNRVSRFKLTFLRLVQIESMIGHKELDDSNGHTSNDEDD